MKKDIIVPFVFLFMASISAQTEWYVGINGNDAPGNGTATQNPFASIDYAIGFLESGDTLFVLGGTYLNDNFGDGDAWKTENAVRINNLHGAPGEYITIKNYDEQPVVFKSDGSNIFRVINCSYLRIEGFEIYGEVENIPLDTALFYQFMYKDADGEIHFRVEPGTPPEVVETMTFSILENIKRPSYTDTRGFYASNSHHLDVISNIVHHAPGTGLRVAKSDYINVIGNEVHNCSRKSYSGTHAFVFHSSTSIDNNDETKIIIARNNVHDNYNEIYSWSPNKTIITPHIDEGKGISMQKNYAANGWEHGRIRIENNIAYGNGFSGIHVNNGDKMDIVNNTVFDNFATGRGGNTGLSLQSGEDINIVNNIVVSNNDFGGNAISAGNSTGLFVSHNLIMGNMDSDISAVETNTIFADPLFNGASQNDFTLSSNSPAINAGSETGAAEIDFSENMRDGNPDIGAYEYFLINGVGESDKNNFIKIYPNPFLDYYEIKGNFKKEEINMFDISGASVSGDIVFEKTASGFLVFCRGLSAGAYFLKIGNAGMKVVKR